MVQVNQATSIAGGGVDPMGEIKREILVDTLEVRR